MKSKLPDIYLKQAMYLEDEGRFQEAEQCFIKARQVSLELNSHYAWTENRYNLPYICRTAAFVQAPIDLTIYKP